MNAGITPIHVLAEVQIPPRIGKRSAVNQMDLHRVIQENPRLLTCVQHGMIQRLRVITLARKQFIGKISGVIQPDAAR